MYAYIQKQSGIHADARLRDAAFSASAVSRCSSTRAPSSITPPRNTPPKQSGTPWKLACSGNTTPLKRN